MSHGSFGGTVVGAGSTPHARLPPTKEYHLLGYIQLAVAVPQDMAHAVIAFLGDGGVTHDDDGRFVPHHGEPR